MITTTVVFVDRLLMSQMLLLRINIKMDTYSPLMFLERCSVWVSADLKHEDEMQQVREEIWERNSDCYCTTDTSSTQITSVITHTLISMTNHCPVCVCVCAGMGGEGREGRTAVGDAGSVGALPPGHFPERTETGDRQVMNWTHTFLKWTWGDLCQSYYS